jgi:hypothetical protein
MQKKRFRSDDVMRVVLTIYTTVFAFLLILFFGIAPFIGFRIAATEALGIIEVLLPVFTGYIGLIAGYYFGNKERIAS